MILALSSSECSCVSWFCAASSNINLFTVRVMWNLKQDIFSVCKSPPTVIMLALHQHALWIPTSTSQQVSLPALDLITYNFTVVAHSTFQDYSSASNHILQVKCVHIDINVQDEHCNIYIHNIHLQKYCNYDMHNISFTI